MILEILEKSFKNKMKPLLNLNLKAYLYNNIFYVLLTILMAFVTFILTIFLIVVPVHLFLRILLLIIYLIVAFYFCNIFFTAQELWERWKRITTFCSKKNIPISFLEKYRESILNTKVSEMLIIKQVYNDYIKVSKKEGAVT